MGCQCGKGCQREEPKGWVVAVLYGAALGLLGTLILTPQFIFWGLVGSTFFFFLGLGAVLLLRRQAKVQRS